MTPEQFDQLKKEISMLGKANVPTVNPPVIKSALDAIPLPMGWKTIIGLAGFLITNYLQSKGAVGAVDLHQYNQLLDIFMYIFGGLGGLGLVAKADRFIQIAIQVLGYTPQVIELLQRLEDAAKKSGDLKDQP